MKKKTTKRYVGRAIFAFAAALLMTVTAGAQVPNALVPVGSAIGIQLQSRGVLVVGFEEGVSSAEKAGIRKGDQILRVDGEDVKTVEELRDAVERGQGCALCIQLQRMGRDVRLQVLPTRTADGYRLGLYARDRVAGVGTVTFYDPESGEFGALGHAVNEPTTGALLQIRSGQVMRASVVQVKKSHAGEPGALKGAFDPAQTVGEIRRNTEQGVFGSLDGQPFVGTALPVASSDEIRTGEATILSNVDGTNVCAYSVQIRKLLPADPHCRNLLLEVTDPVLLEKTGGIVQGMSGSPILQNGKLVGAVTHVLVDKPTTGYGIFIENMLQAAA